MSEQRRKNATRTQREHEKQKEQPQAHTIRESCQVLRTTSDLLAFESERRANVFFFFFISLIADGPHHYHPACGHKGSSHLSPVHPLQFFYRDASSALLQLVNQGLNFTYSRSHAFRYERKNTNPTLVRIELTTSVLADVQLTY